MKYLQRSILISLLLFGLVNLFGVHSAQAIEYGGLGVFPNASEADEKNPLTMSWFIYTLEQNEIKEGKMNIVNISDELQEVRIYPVDAVTTRDGAFAPEPESREKIGVGTWVTLAESELSLKPREIKIVDFTIQVPKDAEVGDHMGAIIVQGKDPAEEVGGSGLRITTRVGVRMYITVPGDLVKELNFKEFSQERHEEIITFYPTLVNEGNVGIRAKGEIEITNASGEVVNTLPIPEREVFPQKMIRIPIEWEIESLRGTFRARAVVIYDGGQALTRELDISISPSGRISLGSGLGLGISIIAVAGLLMVFGGTFRKRKKERVGID